jgi:hypothetical protein
MQDILPPYKAKNFFYLALLAMQHYRRAFQNTVLELIALFDPIAPILNSLLGFLIHVNAFHLHQGNGELVGSPAGHDKHLVSAFFFWSDSHDVKLVSRF